MTHYNVHICTLILVASLVGPTVAVAQDDTETPVPEEAVEAVEAVEVEQEEIVVDATADDGEGESTVIVGATLQNLFIYQNDADFDASESVYNPDGQSVGALTTTLTPIVTWQPVPNVAITYETEIGVNVWSTHDPDQQDPSESDALVMRHRQLFTEGHLEELGLGFKVGYQFLTDATSLFIGHYAGAATLSLDIGDNADLAVTVAQTADPTYEGINFNDTNFVNDTMIYGVEGSVTAGSVDLWAGVWTLDDNHEIGRENLVVTPMAALWAHFDPVTIDLDLALQAGSFTGNALGGEDQAHLAWAAQLGFGLDLAPLNLRLGVLALSPDDDSAANDNFGFTYSGRSASPTRTLTEDELRDRYNNLDERLSVNMGGFFLTRPGLLVTDLSATIDATDWFEPALVVAYGRVLEPANTLDEDFVGVEALVDLAFLYDDVLIFDIVGGVFLPGGAAGAVVNDIDRADTQTQFLLEAGLTVVY